MSQINTNEPKDGKVKHKQYMQGTKPIEVRFIPSTRSKTHNQQNKKTKLFGGMHSFIATCPKNLEGLLESELTSFGIANTQATIAGVKFKGTIRDAYRVCLWSRIANRVLLSLCKTEIKKADDLYDAVYNINWSEHFRSSDTFIVDFVGTSPIIDNSHFGSLKVKDAIVDQMRYQTGQRPSIDKDNPTLRVNAYLKRDTINIGIDLSGDSLHQRNYRSAGGAAPLKENLAAAILYRTNWPQLAAQNKPFIDPMCGSGTILIEAGLIAADIAPGLLRKSFGFINWLKHEKAVWQELIAEANERRNIGLKKLENTLIYGCDANHKIIEIARHNIKHAGLEKHITITASSLIDFTSPIENADQRRGLLVTNPPYGERLGDKNTLSHLYRRLGTLIKEQFPHWQAGILTSDPELGHAIGLHADKQYNLYNGALACKLLVFHGSE